MKLFVWDFHGVLEKDNEYAVEEVCNRVLAEFGVERRATVQECLDLYGEKWAVYYRFYCPEADEETIHKMVDRAVEIGVKEQITKKYIKPMDYAHYVLEEIASKGYMNIIMSNSSPEALDMFLESVDMAGIFEHEYAADRHRENANDGNSKEIWLRKFLEKNEFDEIIVIDDSPAGIEMGKRLGAKTYHFSRKSKAKIKDLREVLKEL